MRAKFFIYINDEVNKQPAFTEHISYEERTRQQLATQMQLLTAMVENAARSHNKDTMPIVLCAEDFFQGGEICTAAEENEKSGQCYNRDIAYHFIAGELTRLSLRYPDVLIIPGTMYVSVPATQDPSTPDRSVYEQNNGKRPGRIYTQNIAPVLYGGKLIRLLKKGDYLIDTKTKTQLTTSEQHIAAATAGNKLEVPFYNEDTLEDMNSGLIHLGKTPLPGEAALMTALNMNPDELFSPVFTVKGITFGLEICGDHTRQTLAEEDVDFHLISSNGIGWTYNAGQEKGYRVQADAESRNLTSITRKTSSDLMPLKDAGGGHSSVLKHHESNPLTAIRHNLAMKQVVAVINEYAMRAPRLTGGVFVGQKPRPFREMQAVLDDLKAEKISVRSALTQIIDISGTMGKHHPIKTEARRVLNQINNPPAPTHAHTLK
ncbi:hypothetical protein [Legionella spiritensis]|uniref:hypothetical protein n=1 Tax=Legionella spiritensis TaxID=452 RepID=UPI000F71A393|nr:hypothetical protein [Legionella spiritensis]VEG91950.1 Uncharacterised protein [Legionella spiritensis]